MAFRFLIDENTDPNTALELRSRGHDAVAVRDVNALGTGTLDPEVIEYAREHGYVVLTSDKGFVPPANRVGVTVVFCQDDDLGPKEIGMLVDELVEYTPIRAELPEVYHIKRDFLP